MSGVIGPVQGSPGSVPEERFVGCQGYLSPVFYHTTGVRRREQGLCLVPCLAVKGVIPRPLAIAMPEVIS